MSSRTGRRQMAERRRRAGDGVRLPVYLEGDHCTVESADGFLVGLGFKAYLDPPAPSSCTRTTTCSSYPASSTPESPERRSTTTCSPSTSSVPVGPSRYGPNPPTSRDRFALAVFGGDSGSVTSPVRWPPRSHPREPVSGHGLGDERVVGERGPPGHLGARLDAGSARVHDGPLTADRRRRRGWARMAAWRTTASSVSPPN